MTETEKSAKTDVIYARVPAGVKAELQAYADANGKKLAGAVAELLTKGLAAEAAEAPVFSSAEEWCEEQYALLRIESISRMMNEIGAGVISGRVQDVTYYRRARVMLARAVAEWGLALPASKLSQESGNG
jgi:hypothetical protein